MDNMYICDVDTVYICAKIQLSDRLIEKNSHVAWLNIQHYASIHVRNEQNLSIKSKIVSASKMQQFCFRLCISLMMLITC